MFVDVNVSFGRCAGSLWRFLVFSVRNGEKLEYEGVRFSNFLCSLVVC